MTLLTPNTGLPTATVRHLRLENAVTAGLALAAFHIEIGNWWLFAACILLPDVSMIGYLRGPKLGALMYNVAHSYVLALPITGIGFYTGSTVTQTIGLILTAHVALDRALGYGLKMPTGFVYTHLGQLNAPQNQQASSP